MRIKLGNGFHGPGALFTFPSTNQNPIRIFQILNRRAFCKELRIGDHLEMSLAVSRVQNPGHRLCCSYRQGAFFHHHHLRLSGMGEDVPCGLFPILEVCGPSCSLAEHLGRGVDRNKNDVRFCNRLVDAGAEKKVLSAGFPDPFIQSGFIDRKIFAVPATDPLFVDIDNGDFMFRTITCNGRHSGSTNVSCTYA